MSKFTIVYDSNGLAESEAMLSTSVEYGVATPLRKNTFSRTGYNFAGWKALRMSDQRTCYINKESKARRFFIENEQPDGWELYIYSDEFKVAKLSKIDNDVVTMYAQWEKKDDYIPASAEYNKKVIERQLLNRPIVLYGGANECKRFYTKYSDRLNIRCILVDDREDIVKLQNQKVAVKRFKAGELKPEDYVVICRTVKVRMDNLYRDARKNLTKTGRIVMQDFLRADMAEMILNKKKLWLWFGYCQLESLRKDLFKNIKSVDQEYTMIAFRYGLDTVKTYYKFDDCIEMLKICDCLTYVPLVFSEGKMDFSFETYLATDAKVMTLPRIPFRGYYPYRDSDMENFFKFTFDGKKHWPFAYQENIIDQLLLEGKTDDEIYETLMDPDLISEDKIKKCLKVSYKFIEISERTTDIKILDYIKDNFQKRMIYRDGLHYQNFLYFELARRICAFLGLNCEDEINEFEAYTEEQGIQFIDYTEVPVLPCVVKALGLDFITDETLWRVRFTENGTWLGTQRIMEQMTRKEWIYTYVRYARACMTLQEYWNKHKL